MNTNNIIEIDEINDKIYIEIRLTETSFVKKEISSEEAGKLLRSLKSVLMRNNTHEV
jgi:hypothetical protein